MKTLSELLNESLNESVSLMVHQYAAKPLFGKFLFPFKKQIEKIKFVDAETTLKEINAEWDKFKKSVEKILTDEIVKQVTRDEILFITATLNNKWILYPPHTNPNDVTIMYGDDFIVNVGFEYNTGPKRYSKRLTGEIDGPVFTKNTIEIAGKYDADKHNIEIRGRLYLTVDRR